MVTAFIPGPSLQQAVAEGGPFSLERVRQLGAGLAEGLAAIHACGLVHRDLKPSNVILADDGPRIIDFGIARAAKASPMTTAGMVVGTYSYMSPEQLRGEVAGQRRVRAGLHAGLRGHGPGHLRRGLDRDGDVPDHD